MSENKIANFSQTYIDHLRTETTKAENRLKEETKIYEVKNNQLADATKWQTAIDAYWNRVKATEDLADAVFMGIHNLLTQAKKVNDNIEYTLDAVKLLVCNVREVSNVLETMTEMYHTLKSDIDKVVTRDSSFKRDKIYDKLTVLGDKLTIAGQAVETVITKVLDLAKATYLLHRAMDSERHEHQDWVVDHVFVEYIDKDGSLKPLEIYETTEVLCGERTIQEPGLEWQVKKLDMLLREGMPHPTEDFGDYPSDEPDTTWPTFPLNTGHDRYYNITSSQHQVADKKVKEIRKELDAVGAAKLQADSSYKAFKAALDAAEAAKK